MRQALLNMYNLGVKELRGIFRDVFLVALIIFSFTFQLKSAFDAATDTIHDAAVAVVDEDHSKLSERITESILPPYFLRPVTLTRPEIDVNLDNGNFTFVIVIPVNFQKDIEAGYAPDIQINVDATRMSQAFTGTGYLTKIIDQEVKKYRNQQKNQQEVASYVIRNKYNPNLTSSWFETVVQLINSVTLLSIILTGSALIRERERGTLEHLLVMPVTPLQIMVSKVWSMGVIIFVCTLAAMVGVIHWWLKIPINGSLALFMLGAVLHMFAMTSMGISLACVASSMSQLGLLMILILMPLNMLSGGNTPRESMPEIVQKIMLFAPTTHFVCIAQTVLYRGGGLSAISHNIAWLVGEGGFFFFYSLCSFRRSLNNG